MDFKMYNPYIDEPSPVLSDIMAVIECDLESMLSSKTPLTPRWKEMEKMMSSESENEFSDDIFDEDLIKEKSENYEMHYPFLSNMKYSRQSDLKMDEIEKQRLIHSKKVKVNQTKKNKKGRIAVRNLNVNLELGNFPYHLRETTLQRRFSCCDTMSLHSQLSGNNYTGNSNLIPENINENSVDNSKEKIKKSKNNQKPGTSVRDLNINCEVGNFSYNLRKSTLQRRFSCSNTMFRQEKSTNAQLLTEKQHTVDNSKVKIKKPKKNNKKSKNATGNTKNSRDISRGSSKVKANKSKTNKKQITSVLNLNVKCEVKNLPYNLRKSTLQRSCSCSDTISGQERPTTSQLLISEKRSNHPRDNSKVKVNKLKEYKRRASMSVSNVNHELDVVRYNLRPRTLNRTISYF